MSPATFIPILLFNVASVLVSLLSSDLILMWFMMEVNMFTFVMMMMVDMSKKSMGNSLKYFLYQAMASVLFLYSVSHYSSSLTFLTGAIVVMKMGLAPFHFWFMSISKNLNLGLFFWMSTMQKVIPLLILSYIVFPSQLLSLILGVSLISSVVNLLVQVKIVGVLASSSVFANNWLLSGSMTSVQVSLKFMAVYLLIQASLISIIYSMGTSSFSNLAPHSSGGEGLLLFLSLLMLGGMPPSPLFFAKLELLLSLCEVNMIFFAMGLLVASSVSFYGYINTNMFKICSGTRGFFIKPFLLDGLVPLALLGGSCLVMVM